jgi:hypothetical protein
VRKRNRMPKKNDPIDEEFRQEAERLAKLPIADQRAIIALHWSVAKDVGVSEGNRKLARQRAKALERLLKIKATKFSKKS